MNLFSSFNIRLIYIYKILLVLIKYIYIYKVLLVIIIYIYIYKLTISINKSSDAEAKYSPSWLKLIVLTGQLTMVIKLININKYINIDLK